LGRIEPTGSVLDAEPAEPADACNFSDARPFDDFCGNSHFFEENEKAAEKYCE